MSKKEGKPKRGLSAYMFFCQEQRPEVAKKHPEMKFGELGKMLGEMWRALDESKKEPYKQKAMKDKERYMNEIAKVKEEKKKGSSSDSDKLD